MASTLDEEQIIKLIWKRSDTRSGGDPFDDDAAWFANRNKKLIVCKADMLVAKTDVPRQMTPYQMGRKAIVSCVSDLAAKGVKPLCAVISIGLPRRLATRNFLSGLARGFRAAQQEYDLEIIGGDTNATAEDTVIDVQVIGASDSIVRRKGARPGNRIGATGTFGHQRAGLLMLLGKALPSDRSFKMFAQDSVLRPKARLEFGLNIAPYLTSSIDSSDGLAISLYHLAESSRVDLKIDTIPISKGVVSFAKKNHLNSDELALYGGEEFELVFTYEPKFEEKLSKMGVIRIGQVARPARGKKPAVYFRGTRIRREGWNPF